jgi:hypothetical protein
MGLKMVNKNKAPKEKIYKRLSALYFLSMLSFEGVVPTQKNPQTADF